MIMEPLRGGKLVSNLPKEVYNVWEKAYIKRSPAEWAFRWIWNHPEVTVVLSGMNSQEMIEENIRAASQAEAKSFTEEDYNLFKSVRKILQEKIKIPCTGCNYCMPCPMGVDIPTCFACYNDREIEGKMRASFNYITHTSLKAKTHNASLCSKCGKCETHCPQKIKIRDELSKVSKTMEGFFYKPARFILKRFMKI
jgi:predicted aldo/keto reductase-like oxidoreductase